MADVKQFSTFYLSGQLFGVEVTSVQEVIRYQEITPVPLAVAVAGLINLRGQIVTVLDLRRRLRLAARTTASMPLNVVVRSGDEAISLLVDDIGEVVEVGEDVFETPPETLIGEASELIRGVYKLDRSLLLVLDIEKVLEPPAA